MRDKNRREDFLWRSTRKWDQAGIRVGSTAEARLRWLVEDFAAFAGSDAEPESLATEASYFLAQQGVFMNIVDVSIDVEPPHLPTTVFRQLAHDVSTGLDNVLAVKDDNRPSAEWIVRINRPLQRSLSRYTWPRRAPGRRHHETIYEIRSSYEVTAGVQIAFPVVFQLAAMDLLYTSEPWRLARCNNPECKRRFVRKDKRQMFCNPACSQITRTDRYKTKPKNTSTPKNAAPAKSPS